MVNRLDNHPEHTFNKDLNNLINKFQIENSQARVVRLTVSSSEEKPRIYTYIVVSSETPAKCDSLTGLFLDLMYLANNTKMHERDQAGKHIHAHYNFLDGQNIIELNQRNLDIANELNDLAEEISGHSGYRYFQPAFRKMHELKSERQFNIETGRNLAITPYFELSESGGSISFGFRLRTNDERIITKAREMIAENPAGIMIERFGNVNGQYQITSHGRSNEQMLELMEKIPEIAIGKPQSLAQVSG